MKFHIVLDSFISLIYIHKKTQGIDFIMLSHSTHIRIEGHRFQYIYIYIYKSHTKPYHNTSYTPMVFVIQRDFKHHPKNQ